MTHLNTRMMLLVNNTSSLHHQNARILVATAEGNDDTVKVLRVLQQVSNIWLAGQKWSAKGSKPAYLCNVCVPEK